MRRTNAPTLQDVADGAGVSVMMASVVLNGAQSSTRVSASTRERIQQVADRLGYRCNAVARGLSRRRMDAIGVTAIIDGGEINLYFLEVLNGILDAAAEHGQNTTIFSLSDWLKDAHKLLDFCDGRVDGMILIAPTIYSPEKLSHHTPFVTIHGNEQDPATHNIDADNEGGAYAVTRFLIDQGHRHIVHFPGSEELLGVQQRISGFRRAMEEASLSCDHRNIIEGNFSAWSGQQRMAEMLEDHQDSALPTAIFCGSDAIAYGCMEVLASHGIRVPEDISIAGFDDSLIARMTRPPLTTACQPFRQIGRFAVEKLLSLIKDQDRGVKEEDEETANVKHNAGEEDRMQVFPAELIRRESVGPPPIKPIIPARHINRG